MITYLKHALHLQDIYLKHRTNNSHGYHLVQGNVHPCFLLVNHFMLVQDLHACELVFLNILNCFIKGHEYKNPMKPMYPAHKTI
jgi:hypothetical protein